MVKLSRYFMVVIAITGFAIVLPELYWMAFAKPVRAPFVQYSCIENDFLIQRTDSGITRTDTRGNSYTREEYEQRLPLMFARQLLMSNTMPDSVYGIELDNHQITINRTTFRVRPKDIFAPSYGLYPLFESQSGRANLEMPEDYFRITWRMEFLDAATKQINEDKSRMFSAVLYKRGFQFPAKTIDGLPTTRKSCDEGYLVTDNANQLFHLKMVRGEPYVRKIDLPDGLTFTYISCVDFRNKRFYAYLFSEEKEIYVVTQDDYQLIKLPVGKMDPTQNEIRIFGDLFHYNVIETGDDFIRVSVLDAEFRNVDEYHETWKGKMERTEGLIFQALFPGSISMTDNQSEFIRFWFQCNKSFTWLILSVILLVLQLLIIRTRKSPVKNQIADLIIILITGVFGFLSVNIFPNKFFD